MVGCLLFFNHHIEAELYNKQWMAYEIMELVGMLLLDISYIDFGHEIMLIIEVTGFLVLIMATSIQVKFTHSNNWPIFVLNLDAVRVSDCVGLFLLAVVALGKYHIHISSSHGSGLPTNGSHHNLSHKNSGQNVQHSSSPGQEYTPISDHSDTPAPLTRRRGDGISHHHKLENGHHNV